MKKVKLILEYDAGDYHQNQWISINPKDWEEYIQQCDLLACDLKILEVKVEQC